MPSRAFKNMQLAARSPLVVPATDEETALTEGTNLVTFVVPHDMTVSEIFATLNVAQASGDIVTVDVNKNGTSVLSTKITIDNTEKTSLTAATAPVMTSTPLTFTKGDIITIDLDQCDASTVAAGLKVSFNCTLVI